MGEFAPTYKNPPVIKHVAIMNAMGCIGKAVKHVNSNGLHIM